MPMRAVDLSHFQAITDWNALCAYADILIFKATEGSPEGIAFVDPMFASRLAEARRRGKLIGVYHYVGSSTARRVYSAQSEADWLAAHYDHRPGEVPIADYEPRNPPNDPDGWLAAFLQRLTGKGWPVAMTYMNTTAAASNQWTRTRAVNTALWIARYYANNGQVPTTQPSPGAFGSYAMWQYTSNGQVPGVSGPVDVSLFYGTADQWRAIGGSGNPTPPPQEDDMTPDQAQQLADVHQWLRGGDPQMDNIGLIYWTLKGQHHSSDPLGQDRIGDAWTQGQQILAGQDPQALAAAILANLPTAQAEAVAKLVLAGLNGASLNVTAPAAS